MIDLRAIPELQAIQMRKDKQRLRKEHGFTFSSIARYCGCNYMALNRFGSAKHHRLRKNNHDKLYKFLNEVKRELEAKHE